MNHNSMIWSVPACMPARLEPYRPAILNIRWLTQIAQVLRRCWIAAILSKSARSTAPRAHLSVGRAADSQGLCHPRSPEDRIHMREPWHREHPDLPPIGRQGAVSAMLSRERVVRYAIVGMCRIVTPVTWVTT
jgi:hypothetical protein